MPAVRGSRPRPRPRPRFDKLANYQNPCPYEKFNGPFAQWIVTNQSHAILVSPNGDDDPRSIHTSVFTKAYSTRSYLTVSDAWIRRFPGCHSRRWRPDVLFESRGVASGVISRDSMSLVVFVSVYSFLSPRCHCVDTYKEPSTHCTMSGAGKRRSE
jgi:hypothetical protein